ncbi:hypothetical protein [Polyangium sorediatum]|uniref:Uncharacterized protein n=1 Tax=Polyangium sorediatum TaxID=889274 RepID=A0ABT6P3I7_9BACT|nr:hypothetical protein [Polyangium sorediatum]MDI1435177.1 hypothetical protein [Polyangium sorediatum]
MLSRNTLLLSQTLFFTLYAKHLLASLTSPARQSLATSRIVQVFDQDPMAAVVRIAGYLVLRYDELPKLGSDQAVAAYLDPSPTHSSFHQGILGNRYSTIRTEVMSFTQGFSAVKYDDFHAFGEALALGVRQASSLAALQANIDSLLDSTISYMGLQLTP